MTKDDILEHLPLETERLIIRTITLEDVDEIHAAMVNRDEALRKWMSWSSDVGMSREGVTAYIKNGLDKANTCDIPLLATDKTSGKFVMCSGIQGVDDNFETLETGWWMAASFEGQGLAYEAMTKLNQFSFDVIGTKTIQTEYYADNVRSKNLMERLGFQYVTTEPQAHRSHLDGTAMDIHKYRLEKQK